MTKAAGCLSFATKATQPFSVVANLRRQDFYRDAITQQNVTRQINRSHPALAKQRFNLVLAVEHRTNDGRRVIFQHLPVSGAEADTVLKLCFTDCAISVSYTHLRAHE